MIETRRFLLRPLTLADCTERYRAWFDDPEITRFLESGPQTIASLCDYVEGLNASGNTWLFGIFLADKHLGNIKVGPLGRHPVAEVSLIIGDKSCWGLGVATEAIEAVSRHAFAQLGIRKLWAGMYAENVGSTKAFEHAGYRREAHHRAHYLLAGKMADIIELGLAA